MSVAELKTLEAMSILGGDFVRGLASLYCVATEQNREVIRQTWPDEWATYTAFGMDNVTEGWQ